jgi:hypothetical protein
MRHTNMRTGLRGSVFLEAVIGIVLLGLVVALAAEAMFTCQKSRNQSIDRQAILWAASGQLRRITAGAAPDSQPPDGMLPAGISLQTQTQAGAGQWQGFTRVTVTATTVSYGGEKLCEQVSGFVRMEGRP